MDTKKFTAIVAAMTVVVCIITVVFNFASMPSYSDSTVSAVPLYNNAAQNENVGDDETPLSDTNSSKNQTSSKTSSAASKSSSSKASTSSKSKTAATKEKSTEQNPVNINTASLEKLESIPYVGATHAQAIIDYRAAHGNFSNVDELDNVKGFGSATIEKIRKYITVG